MLWTTCAEGHDLTGEDAYVTDQRGNRRCRVCASAERRKRKAPEPRTEGAYQ